MRKKMESMGVNHQRKLVDRRTRDARSPVSVGQGIAADNASWSFAGKTPLHFTEHVKKSVPFYSVGHDLIRRLSDYFVKPTSTCYELGVSTGALIRTLAMHNPKSVRWIGIDVQADMIAQARKEVLDGPGAPTNIELVVDDILLHPFEPADFVVSYYTIQFVPPRLRQQVFNRVYESLNWGGAFVMFEKVRGPDARFQDIMTGIYTDYKLEQGYTPEEIIAKSRSLKGVLEPFSTQGNIDLCKRAGFSDYMTIFKYVCFEGFLCIK